MVLDDDATGAIGGGSAVEEVGARGGLLCGGYRGDGFYSSEHGRGELIRLATGLSATLSGAHELAPLPLQHVVDKLGTD